MSREHASGGPDADIISHLAATGGADDRAAAIDEGVPWPPAHPEQWGTIRRVARAAGVSGFW